MNVLHLSKYHSPYCGGVEQVVADLCSVLSEQGHKVGVICTNHNKGNVTELVDGIIVYRCHTNFKAASTALSLQYITQLKKIIDQYDILHVHLPNPMANLALLCCQFNNKKIIVHWHSDIVRQSFLKVLYSPLQTWLLNKSNTIVATSPSYAESSNVLRRWKEKLKVVPIGIDPNRMSVDFNEVAEIKSRYPGKKLVFSLGRHVYYKGFIFLIEAAARLPDDYVILLGGAGPLTQSYCSAIKKLSLHDKVFLLGRIPDEKLSSYFAAADVFCLPSIERSEAFGVVQLESFSVGTPVISCDIPGSGVAWVNRDQETGLVIKPRDPIILSEAIKTCCGSARDTFSHGALERLRLLFTRDIMGKSIIDIYQSK